MTEEEITKKIEELKTTLIGDLFLDGETQQEIYALKKLLKPEIEEQPELDDDEDCLSCGA